MNVLDLFSGIGGFSLGLERAGMRTVAFCEIDPYCRRVLAKHWPDVPVFGDVRTITAEALADTVGGQLRQQPGRRDGASGAGAAQPRQYGTQGIDVICGGFPCQDISAAGKGAGIDGERSGLWSEYARVIGEVRPRYVIVENVAALLGRGLSRVLGDLAALGFDAEWHCIPASAVGAPHRRDRIWIVAYRDGGRQPQLEERNGQSLAGQQASQRDDAVGCCTDVADTISEGLEGRALLGGYLAEELAAVERGGEDLVHADSHETRRTEGPDVAAPRWWGEGFGERCGDRRNSWLTEPDVGRVAHGVPARVDRLRSLGNAVVPQIPEIIGRAIMMRESAL